MTESETAPTPEATPLPLDVADAQSRAAALNELRVAENLRLAEERSVRRNLLLIGVIVGAAAGMVVGYLGTLITIVDAGSGEFGFEFYRPSFVDGYLRAVSAYLIGGGVVGGLLSHWVFTTRAEASSILRWIIVGVIYAILTPLLIGFLLPLTLLIFGDFVEGLRPGLWLSAFVETLLGSFLDGYIFMVKVLAAGWLGTAWYLIVAVASYLATLRLTIPAAVRRVLPGNVAIYVAAFVVAAIPVLAFALLPLDAATAFTAFLTGERL